MKKWWLCTIVLVSLVSEAQMVWYTDSINFDPGSAPLRTNIYFDTSSTWTIGSPSKFFTDTACSLPNVLQSDSVKHYLPRHTSYVDFGIQVLGGWWFLHDTYYMKMEWKQKMEVDDGFDGGVIEHRIDPDTIWTNSVKRVQIDGLAYNDSLFTGEPGLSVTDTLWHSVEIFFYLDVNKLWGGADSLHWRFVFKSDSIDNPKRGWMIDNLNWTIIRYMGIDDPRSQFSIQPSISNGKFNLIGNELQLIETVELINIMGSVYKIDSGPVQSFDIVDYPPGIYLLRLSTDDHTETHRIIKQ